jgi:hypothetical protein
MLLQLIASMVKIAAEVLTTQGGRIALLDSFILSGLVGDRIGVPYAGHITMATLAVVLVDLGQPGGAPYGIRLTALLVLMLIGVVGASLHVQAGEQVVLSSFAVLLVVIQDDRDHPNGAAREPNR